jgi:two-component system response regulator AtoC
MTGFEGDVTRSLQGSAQPDEPRVVVAWEGGMVVRPLRPGKVLILGRGRECDVPVLHPSVSRRHARIAALAPPHAPMSIEDLGSTHGVRVDGRLLAGGAQEVWPGQVVEVGAAMVLVQQPAHSPRAPVAAAGGDFERFVAFVGRSQLPVLLVGEAGPDREAMAKRIHALSPRKDGPFVRLDSAAVPPAQFESDLCGHEQGAFSGADREKRGHVEAANHGTLFVDEVGEIPLAAQAMLLRILETGEVRRIGSLRPLPVDVRVLSATTRDLEASARDGAFRRDLLFRLNGVTVHVPTAGEPRAQPEPPTLPQEIDRLEREKIVQALATADGNQTRAASILGISRRALINRLDAYALPRPRKKT